MERLHNQAASLAAQTQLSRADAFKDIAEKIRSISRNGKRFEGAGHNGRRMRQTFYNEVNYLITEILTFL